LGTSEGFEGGWLGTYYDYPLGFFTADSRFAQMVLSTSGNLGIGTIAPDEALHVAGKVKIEEMAIGATTDSLVTWNPADSTLRVVAASSIGGGGGGVFENASGVVRNTGTHASDDFIFGSDSLNDMAGTDDDSRFFFDKNIVRNSFYAKYCL